MKKIIIGLTVLLVFSMSLAFTQVDDWSLRIGVKRMDEKYRDTHNYIGTAQDGFLYYDQKDIPEPPTSPSGLCLYFPHSDWSFMPGRYASDIRSPMMDTETFEFVVEAGEYTQLTLIWPNMAEVPQGFGFLLIDEEREVFVDMKRASEYTFDCRPEHKNRFRIVVDNR
jgi:hypothetical protein